MNGRDKTVNDRNCVTVSAWVCRVRRSRRSDQNLAASSRDESFSFIWQSTLGLRGFVGSSVLGMGLLSGISLEKNKKEKKFVMTQFKGEAQPLSKRFLPVVRYVLWTSELGSAGGSAT